MKIRRMVAAASVGAVLGCAAAVHAGPSSYEEVAAGFDFVTVGDPGNPGLTLPDPTDRFENNLGRGAVDYSFRVARTEVTTDQFIDFVNTFSTISDAINQQLTFGVNWTATFDRDYSGPGELWKVSRLNGGINNVDTTWYRAAMYVNWLHHGKTTNYDDLFSGVYEVDIFFDSPTGQQISQIRRSEDARFWLPSLDELLKAGYWDPEVDADGDGEAEGGWWTFSNRSHEPPVSGVPGQGETARGVDEDELADAIGFINTDFGSFPTGLYPETASAYGLLDISGTGEEWTDSLAVGRELQGAFSVLGSSPAFSESLGIFNERADTGSFRFSTISESRFRIATSIPAPTTGCFVLSFMLVRRPRHLYEQPRPEAKSPPIER